MILLKGIILTTLTITTSLTVLLMRLSRIQAESDENLYLPSTVVFLTECHKFILCIISLIVVKGPRSALLSFKDDILGSPRETLRLAIPAILYTIQNNLLYVALTFLDSATYQVTYQLKILSTAFFSVVMLQRKLRPLHWIALSILSLGVMMVQIQATEGEAILISSSSQRFIGLLCICGACLTSGASGVYFELLVKKSAQQSVLIRNLQLGLISVPMTTVPVIFEDFSTTPFFQGYDALTYLIIFLQTYGGLLVAVVIKYADNILKGFSTSISIVVCSIFSHFVIEKDDDEIDGSNGYLFPIGATLVVLATLLYSFASFSKKSNVANKTSLV